MKLIFGFALICIKKVTLKLFKSEVSTLEKF